VLKWFSKKLSVSNHNAIQFSCFLVPNLHYTPLVMLHVI
jgi:hypothetical protein